MNANIAARLAERAARHPTRVAIIDRRRAAVRRTTFGELSSRVAGLAAGLRSRGLSPGDRVLLFVPMSTDLYVAMLAVLHLGGVAVFVDAWAGRARLDAAVAAARPRAFIGTPRAHLLRLVSPAVRSIPIAIVCDPRWAPLERLERPEASGGLEPVPGEAPGLVTFTTGSTGRPKAAVRSHGFLWSQHEVLAAHLGLSGDDVDMPTLPIFVLNNLATGTPSVIPDFDPRRPAEIDPGRIHAVMVAEGVTSTSGSPAFYERLARWCAARRVKIPVRVLFTGGAPVLPTTARLLADTVAGAVRVLYGSTEAEPIAAIDAPVMLAAMCEPGVAGLCAGTPVPEIELRLVRPWDGPIALGPEGWRAWEVGAGEVGEVVVAGPHVLPGYLHDSEADHENKIRDGSRIWHRTGDGARRDAQGRLWLMGRVKQRVRRGGEVWWGMASELCVLALPEVRHAAYFGRPDPDLGQRAAMCVETGSGTVSADLERRLRAALGEIPVDEILAFRHIPRDPRHASKTDWEGLVSMLERSSPRRAPL